MRLWILALMIIAGMSFTIVGSIMVHPVAEGAPYQPTEHIKTWTRDTKLSITDPIFYVNPGGLLGTGAGWIKIGVDVSNNDTVTRNIKAVFHIDGIAVDYIDNQKVSSIAPGETITITSIQRDVKLSTMVFVISIVSEDGNTLYAQKSEIIKLNTSWQLVSIAPEIWYDVPAEQVAYKLSNVAGKTNTEAGTIELYTELFISYRMNNKQINYIELALSKVGNPTGHALIGVFDTVDGKPVIKKLFGKLDVSTLSTQISHYRLYSPDVYIMTSGKDFIGILYEQTNPENNYVQVYMSTGDEFGSTSDRIRYSIGNENTNYYMNAFADVSMKIGWEAYQILECDDPNNDLRLYFCSDNTFTGTEV